MLYLCPDAQAARHGRGRVRKSLPVASPSDDTGLFRLNSASHLLQDDFTPFSGSTFPAPSPPPSASCAPRAGHFLPSRRWLGDFLSSIAQISGLMSFSLLCGVGWPPPPPVGGALACSGPSLPPHLSPGFLLSWWALFSFCSQVSQLKKASLDPLLGKSL